MHVLSLLRVLDAKPWVSTVNLDSIVVFISFNARVTRVALNCVLFFVTRDSREACVGDDCLIGLVTLDLRKFCIRLYRIIFFIAIDARIAKVSLLSVRLLRDAINKGGIAQIGQVRLHLVIQLLKVDGRGRAVNIARRIRVERVRAEPLID